MKTRYGVNADGTLSPCRARPENVGRYGCKHSEHMEMSDEQVEAYYSGRAHAGMALMGGGMNQLHKARGMRVRRPLPDGYQPDDAYDEGHTSEPDDRETILESKFSKPFRITPSKGKELQLQRMNGARVRFKYITQNGYERDVDALVYYDDKQDARLAMESLLTVSMGDDGEPLIGSDGNPRYHRYRYDRMLGDMEIMGRKKAE